MEKGGMLMLVLTVDRGIVTEPPVVFFGLLSPENKAPVVTQVTITRRAGPFHVKSVSVNDPKVDTKLETIREGGEYRVTLTYTGGWDLGVKRRTLTLTTDDPKQPSITVPVQGIVQAKAAVIPPAAAH
jgi:hypothetical protein